MTESKTNPLFRLMPSLTDLAFLCPLMFLFVGLNGVRTMLGDGDTGWHIRTGEWIVSHMAVPRQDMFSFTKPGAPFFAWEWLWDVCFSWIHGRWGLGGVVLVSIFVMCATSALLYKLVLRVTAREGRENPLVAIALTGLAMAGASMHWLARPHLFTMLFLVVFLMVLEKTRGQENRGQRPEARGQEEEGARGQEEEGARGQENRGQGPGASKAKTSGTEHGGQGSKIIGQEQARIHDSGSNKGAPTTAGPRPLASGPFFPGPWPLAPGLWPLTPVRRWPLAPGPWPLTPVRRWPLAPGPWPLLWLPLLTILWTNLHGGFIIGIALVAMYGAGPLVSAMLASGARERIAQARNAVPYLAAAAACALASLVNPYTYHLHQHIYSYLHDGFIQTYISEFQPTSFRWGAASFFEIMLVLAAGAAVWYGLRREFTEVVVLAGWAHVSLLIARNVPIFMIVAAPLVARPAVHWLRALAEAPVAGWLRSVFANFEEIGMELRPMERPWRVHAVSAAALLLLAGAMNAPGAGPKLKPEFDPQFFPAAALAALDSPGQRIFAHDQWSDYLIYRLYPRGGRVYIDGRSDFYGKEFCLATLGVLNVKYDWEKTLALYGVDTLLLPADAALAGAVKQSPRWRVSYDDGRALVFRPAESAPGAGSQVSAGTASGLGGRDLPVTESARVNPQDHVFQQTQREGVNP